MAVILWKTNLVVEDLVRKKTEENVSNVRAVASFDRHLTVTMIGSELNLDHQTVHDTLTEELGMRTLGCCIMAMVPVTLPSP
jgi:hypothetical protein